MSRWDFVSGLEWARDIETALVPAGWHCALAGSVLHRGSSTHDLDLVVFPHERETGVSDRQLRKLADALRGLRMTRKRTVRQIHRYWRTKGSHDCKHVETWQTPNGRRIDLLVLS